MESFDTGSGLPIHAGRGMVASGDIGSCAVEVSRRNNRHYLCRGIVGRLAPAIGLASDGDFCSGLSRVVLAGSSVAERATDNNQCVGCSTPKYE